VSKRAAEAPSRQRFAVASAEHGDVALRRSDDSENHPNRGRFAAAVGAQEPEDLSLPDREAQILHDSLLSIALGESTDLQDAHEAVPEALSSGMEVVLWARKW